jgi:Lecithin:cholesterol acyltransferase
MLQHPIPMMDASLFVQKEDDNNHESQLISSTLHQHDNNSKDNKPLQTDELPDGMLFPFDTHCTSDQECFNLPESSIETMVVPQQTCSSSSSSSTKTTTAQQNDQCTIENIEVDKHWGSDKRILSMRDKLRKLGSGTYNNDNDTSTQQKHHPFDLNRRPPIFLLPGLASTRLVAWKHKSCPHNPLLSDIKFHDYVWLNTKLLFQMGTIDATCWLECMALGPNQTDSFSSMSSSSNSFDGCKLRPDEGLDAIGSLTPTGSVGADLLVGQTNTLFAWLVQWLADNLGYDVSNLIGLPYDWRLSPNMMERRDGFFSQTRRRIEAAVASNGGLPGILVAHSVRMLSFS